MGPQIRGSRISGNIWRVIAIWRARANGRKREGSLRPFRARSGSERAARSLRRDCRVSGRDRGDCVLRTDGHQRIQCEEYRHWLYGGERCLDGGSIYRRRLCGRVDCRQARASVVRCGGISSDYAQCFRHAAARNRTAGLVRNGRGGMRAHLRAGRWRDSDAYEAAEKRKISGCASRRHATLGMTMESVSEPALKAMRSFSRIDSSA
jgi:hypothetical protein